MSEKMFRDTVDESTVGGMGCGGEIALLRLPVIYSSTPLTLAQDLLPTLVCMVQTRTPPSLRLRSLCICFWCASTQTENLRERGLKTAA